MRFRLPFFARHDAGHFGKMGPALGTLRLGHRTEDRLRQEAARAGIPLMQFVRELVELRVHGRDEVEREVRVRLDHVDGRKTSATESKQP